MKRVKTATVGMLCALLCAGVFAAVAFAGGGSVFAADAGSTDLLSEQRTQGSYVYDADAGEYRSAAPCGEVLTPVNRLTGVEKWTDGAGDERALRELTLRYGVRMHVVKFASDHTVPTLLIAQTADTETYLQLRASGVLYLFEDKVPVLTATDQTIVTQVNVGALFAKDGDSYRMDVTWQNGSISVSLNGTQYISAQEVNGAPVFKLRTNNGHGAFSELSWSTTSDVRSFVKTYPDPYEGNENLLDLPDYGNTTSAGLTATGNTFTPDSADTKNYLISNEYMESMNFYRPDTDEYSDGADLDYVISADVVFGAYNSPVQGWYGGGIIFGETNGGHMIVRLMQLGTAYVHSADKTSGNDLTNEWSTQAGSFSTAAGTQVNVKVYYVGGKFSLLINGEEAIKQRAIKMTPKCGVHVQNNKITIRNFDFRYVQPVKVTPAEPKSEETAQFDFDARGKMNNTRVSGVIDGDVSSFTVTTSAQDDYFLMKSKARESENLYRMTGTESAVPVANKTLTTVLSARLENVQIQSDGALRVVFRHNVSGVLGAQLVLHSSGAAELQTGSGDSPVVAASAKLPELPQSFTLRIIGGAQTVSVYVNDALLFKNVSVPAYDNAIGFGGVKATYTVNDISYKYMDDVRIAAPQKETFVSPMPSGDANTEYIAPTLPQPKDEGKAEQTPDEGGCGSAAASAFPAMAAILLWSAISAAVARRSRVRR